MHWLPRFWESALKVRRRFACRWYFLRFCFNQAIYMIYCIAGHALMIEVSRQIKAIARAHHVAVLLTCHAVSQGRRTAGQKGLRAACGESWSYVADTRLFCSANPYYSSDADAADPRAFPSLAVLHKSCRSKLGSVRPTTAPVGAMLWLTMQYYALSHARRLACIRSDQQASKDFG